jgi:broad specificity phosphatase PhoE
MSSEVVAAVNSEAGLLRQVVVHPGDAGNGFGCKWWTPGVESGVVADRRVRSLVETIVKLSPDADLCLVCHSHLIKEVVRLFSPSDESRRSNSAPMKELWERKLENCGVVALRMDFGPLFPGVDQGLSPPSPSPWGMANRDEDEDEDEDEEIPGPKYITDAAYLFGSSACEASK